jgi:hypothetical protein
MRTFTLEYWQDEGWYVGRLKEVAGVRRHTEIKNSLSRLIRRQLGVDQEDRP